MIFISTGHALYHLWPHHKLPGLLGHHATSTENCPWPLLTILLVCFRPINRLCFYLWLPTTTGSCAELPVAWGESSALEQVGSSAPQADLVAVWQQGLTKPNNHRCPVGYLSPRAEWHWVANAFTGAFSKFSVFSSLKWAAGSETFICLLFKLCVARMSVLRMLLLPAPVNTALQHPHTLRSFPYQILKHNNASSFKTKLKV